MSLYATVCQIISYVGPVPNQVYQIVGQTGRPVRIYYCHILRPTSFLGDCRDTVAGRAAAAAVTHQSHGNGRHEQQSDSITVARASPRLPAAPGTRVPEAPMRTPGTQSRISWDKLGFRLKHIPPEPETVNVGSPNGPSPPQDPREKVGCFAPPLFR